MNSKITYGIIGAVAIFLLYNLISAYSGPLEDTMFARLFSTLAMGIFLGLLAIFYILPVLSQKAAMSMYADSGEAPEPDNLQEARALVAQGEYEQAIVAYRQALEKEPDNRLGWTDMAKLYVEKLEQPELAISSIREGFDSHEWDAEDGAFLLFRISEWQLNDCDDKETGAETLKEVMKKYPSTRHSANAMQQLRGLGYDIDVEVLEKFAEASDDNGETDDDGDDSVNNETDEDSKDKLSEAVSAIKKPDNID